MSSQENSGMTDIAIIGMAAHFPGSDTLAAYWQNLSQGISSIRRLTEEELRASGESPSRMAAKAYVPFAATLDHFADFDAEFFGLSPKDAAIMDPQHRQFLEVSWEALENAAHPPESFDGQIGVFAGCGMGSYFYFNICSNPDLVQSTGMFLLRHTGNDKDFLSTRVSHILDLKGPSLNIQTACSTSLVAVHMAAQSLLRGECDMALAGGVTIELPHARGYLYQDGEILSPDGECHAFDHRAQGTVFGSGAGCVVLRRLSDAIADGDHIWAVLKGSAINNDGAAKAGYLAPSVEGQARAIAQAQADARIDAATVGYVECHGTGTYLGDPIEVAALTQAFRQSTDAVDFAKIGSVKTNIGHLDTAAGAASLIKTALALHHRQIPPSLGFEAPNPSIDFENSPFRVNDRLSDFPALGAPRRAGVNSLGVGGTNAHAILEEAPLRAPSGKGDFPFVPLVLSARNGKALDQAAARLAQHLRQTPNQSMLDVAYTLQKGRRAFDRRRVLVARDQAEAISLLEKGDRYRVFTHTALPDPEAVFMFPGGGAQYAGMARDLYETEPVFRDWITRGIAHLQPRLDFDLLGTWLPPKGQEARANAALTRPSVQLPLLMIVEYALAQLWISWGVIPKALIGHSMGENTAACLAGVMSFEDCIGLVHLRGQLFDTVAAGGMVSVPISADQLRPLLGPDLDLACINAPELCVASGPKQALAQLVQTLAAQGIEAQPIQIDIAAHSRMLEPILQRFSDYLHKIPLAKPQIPLISNRTGLPLEADQAQDPGYWVAHLRGTVEFAKGIDTLSKVPNRVYLEVGPGKALSALAQANGVPSNQVLSSLRHADQQIEDDLYFLTIHARLWALGLSPDWEPIWGEGPRHRLPLPSYPFQRSTYFINANTAPTPLPDGDELPLRQEDLSQWAWVPHWRPRAAEAEVDPEDLSLARPRNWLIFTDAHGIAASIVARLREAGHSVVIVEAGDRFAKLAPTRYTLAPEQGREGYDALLADLAESGTSPQQIAHFWLVTEGDSYRAGSSLLHRNLEQGFWSLLHLGQALAEAPPQPPLHIGVFTTGAAAIKGEALLYPEKTTIEGPLGVLPKEVPQITCGQLDLTLPPAPQRESLTPYLLEEMLAAEPTTAALRGARRYVRDYRQVPLAPQMPDLPQGAAILITGGFGGIGLSLAKRLIQDCGARIALLSRQALPPRAEWPAELQRAPLGANAARIRAMTELEALGGTVLCLSADVCNLHEMEDARRQVETAFGPLDAIFHAAGTIDDAPLLAKTPDQIERVFAPKLLGTQVLDQVFPSGTVPLTVLFSSSSTVTRPAGQVDYVAANAYLNAFAQSRSTAKSRVMAINWGIWSDVGMAAEALSAPVPHQHALAGPMLSRMHQDGQGRHVLEAEWDILRWWLDGHRTVSGQALIPGTGYIQLIAEAMAALGAPCNIAIRDLDFIRPLTVTADQPRKIRVCLAPKGTGYAIEIQSEALLNGKLGFETNARAFVATGETAPPDLDLSAIWSRMGKPVEGLGLSSPQEAHLNFGPRWRVLNRYAYGQGEGLAQLALPPAFHPEGQDFAAHPALLDIATGWAMKLIQDYRPDHLWVPATYQSLRLYRPLGAEVLSWIRGAPDNHADRPFASFDITLTSPSGQILAQIEGFQIRRLEGGLQLPALSVKEFTALEADQAPLSAAEARLRHNLSQGITAPEGAEAFLRALALGQSPIVLSSIPLPDLISQANSVPAQPVQNSGQNFARPELDHDYIAPRTPLEGQLAQIWQDLLGVGQVGVEDSFFDLGGHSLIAVRLFAAIRKTWGVDFPISVLFEAPTIAETARLIVERNPSAAQAPDGQSAPPVPLTPPARYTHLVPMHPKSHGQGTPVFIVAGMFGNVLNLRHLAQHLGQDRPFYGLQARGLFGDVTPHDDFVAAATDYLQELRQIQPHGPYLLGGFSGGGLIAWEMARQLEAAGERVAQLVLLDTPLPLRPLLTRRDKALIKLAQFRRHGFGYAAQWWKERKEWQAQQSGPALQQNTHQLHNADIESAFRAALPRYQLHPRLGAVTLIRPPLDRHWRVSAGNWVSAAKEYVFYDNQWLTYAPHMVVIEVSGDHDSMVLEPHVRVMAAHLRRLLTQADVQDLSVSGTAE